MPESGKKPRNKPAERQKPDGQAEHRPDEHENAVLAVADEQGEDQVRREARQNKPQVEHMSQGTQIPAQAAQKVIVQPKGRAQRDGQEKLAALQSERLLHSAKQTAQEAAGFWRILIGERVDRAADGDLSAVDRERLEAQLPAADDQHAARRMQNDGRIVEALDLADAADGQP